jgi:hypothetical protein
MILPHRDERDGLRRTANAKSARESDEIHVADSMLLADGSFA